MFANRRSAGRRLYPQLQHLRQDMPVVLASRRGGVPVGCEIAEDLAIPVASAEATLRDAADEIICLAAPRRFIAVGAHYTEFTQLSDADVVSLLEQRHKTAMRSAATAPT